MWQGIMEAIRVIRKIDSDVLPELKKYKGKKVEIIILPANDEDEKKSDNSSILNLKGVLKDKIDGMEFQKTVRQEWDR